MKIPSFLILICCLALQTWAQYNVIGVDLAGSLRGKYSLTIERSFSDKITGRILIESGVYKKMSPTPNDKYRMTGFGVIPEVRYYLFSGKRIAPKGLFAGAAVRYARFEESYNQISQNGNIINAGLDLGYKFIYKHFSVEALFGANVGRISTGDKFAEASVPMFYAAVKDDEKKFLRGEILIGYVFPVIAKRG